jgi:hypothetical protein
MDKVIYVNNGIRIVQRGEQLFIRYDIGAHVSKYREDEISEQQANIIIKEKGKRFKHETVKVLGQIRSRLQAQGIDDEQSNYSLEQLNNERN